MVDGYCASNRIIEGAVDLILDVGKPSFSSAYANYLRRCANVTEFMVATFGREEGTKPTVLMKSGSSISLFYKEIFYKKDPNRDLVLANAQDGIAFCFPSLSDPHYTRTYRQSIFHSSGIIDKFGTAYWIGDTCYYINYYRLDGESPFSSSDRAELMEASELISHLIIRHFDSQGALASVDTLLSEKNLEQLVRGLSPESPLTEREAQVCTLILMGCSSEAIALRLGIAVSSVITYRRRAYERLGIVSQNELFARVLAQIDSRHMIIGRTI